MMAALATPPCSLSSLVHDLLERPLRVDCAISGLSIDSRRVRPGDLFLAYSGEREDGARYVRDAVAAGAAAVLVEDAELMPREAVPVIGVRDLRQHVATIARRFYRDPAADMQLVAVTGTNGKTTTAHLCAQAMRTLHGHGGYFGTLGYGALHALEAGVNTTPDPLTFQRVLAGLAAEGCRHVALEASSHALSQGRLAGLPLAAAVFTGLGHDHLDYHGTREAYGEAKQRLFQQPGLGTAIVNLDDAYAAPMLAAIPPGVRRWGYSLRANVREADVHAVQLDCSRQGIRMVVRFEDHEATLRSPLLGDFNAQNLLAALAALLACGESLEVACRALGAAEPVRGRMELIHGPAGTPLVCVDYAHSPDSLERVLRALRLPGIERITCVFGCGGDRDTSKRGPMGAIAEALADVVYVTSDNPRSEDPQAIAEAVLAGMRTPAAAHVVLDRASAIEAAIKQAGGRDLVLIAGKGHEATQVSAGAVVAFDDAAVARDGLEAHGHD